MTVEAPTVRSASAPNPDEPLTLSQVLAEEFTKLHQRFEFAPPVTPPQTKAEKKKEENRRRIEIYKAIHGLEEKRWALCLSGGGIRSATFCLGVLQGLARTKLLGRFDYLSTVSGGGYIGSWLTAWIHRDGVKSVLGALEQNENSSLPPERAPLLHLRSFSNYLSPKIGLFSVDTWTLVAIYLRNLFLNWLVFIPLLLAVLLIPRMYASLILRNFGFDLSMITCLDGGLLDALALSDRDQTYILLYAGLFFAALALAYISAYRPSLRKPFAPQADAPGQTTGAAKPVEKPDEEPVSPVEQSEKEPAAPNNQSEKEPAAPTAQRNKKSDDPDDQRTFLRWCLLPLILAIVMLTIGRAWYLLDGQSLSLLHFVAGGAILHLLAWVLTFIVIGVSFGAAVLRRCCGWKDEKLRLRELLVVVSTGALGGSLLWVMSIPEKINRFFPDISPELYACFDGPQLLLVIIFMGILSIGLFGNSMTDEDREWWARAGAWVLITVVVWATLSALVLYGPLIVKDQVQGGLADNSVGRTFVDGVLIPFGVISGFVTILFSVSAKTPANERQAEKAGRLTTIMDYAVKLAAPVFVLSLIVALSLFTDLLILLIKHVPEWYRYERVNQWGRNFPDFDHHAIILNTPFLFLFVLFLTLLGISILMAWCVNVNEFSLHSMYRNRLIRAYLGASRQRADEIEESTCAVQPCKHRPHPCTRKPNRFTGFDPADDLRMSELWPNENAHSAADKKTRCKNPRRPLHIVNMTWNLVQGKNLAWQHRKAATFTVSPLHCGSYLYGYRHAEHYGGEKSESISLGTAFTISGAAASPNMGYYSSSAVTFLMALFNARLGWWLGNPCKEFYSRSGPKWALKPMIDEAFGKTDEDKSYVYLSDGGHFENLGLYEMVLRRCHTIFVIDASSDPDRKFENLGNAIRRIRVDLGVPIEILDIVNYPEKQDAPKTYCAIGDIRYKQVDGAEGVADGVLIYIKPMLTGREPTDVFNYAKANLKFPHESISDQFFSEQQFESYRVLGSYAIEQIFNAALPTEENFGNIRSYVEKYLKRSAK
jgi:hypothetical protein